MKHINLCDDKTCFDAIYLGFIQVLFKGQLYTGVCVELFCLAIKHFCCKIATGDKRQMKQRGLKNSLIFVSHSYAVISHKALIIT